jgi:hypothetical protein
MSHLVLLIISWGALAFGAVYAWAYWPLLAACAAAGVWGLVRRAPRSHTRINAPVLVGIVLVVVTVVVQLIPLTRDTLLRVSPSTDNFLRQYDVGYALRVASQTRAGSQTPATAQPGPEHAPRATSPLASTDVLSAADTPLVHTISFKPDRTWLGLAFLGVFGLLLLGLTRGLGDDDVRRLMPRLAILGSVVAVVAIVQAAFGNGRVYGFWEPIDAGARVFGPFINRNHFAGWMLLALPPVMAVIAARIDSGKARSATTLGVAAALMLVALVLSLSRSGVVCLLLALTMTGYAVLRNHPRVTRKHVLVGLLVVVALAVVGRLGLGTNAAHVAAAGPDLGGHAGVWTDAWRVHEYVPLFGSGLNTFGTAMTMLQEFEVGRVHFAEARNDYLQILVEGGYVMSLAVIVLIVIVVWQIRLSFRDGRDGADGGDDNDRASRWIRLGAITALIAMMLQESVEFSLQIPGSAALFTVLCAVALRRATPREPREQGLS